MYKHLTTTKTSTRDLFYYIQVTPDRLSSQYPQTVLLMMQVGFLKLVQHHILKHILAAWAQDWSQGHRKNKKLLQGLLTVAPDHSELWGHVHCERDITVFKQARHKIKTLSAWIPMCWDKEEWTWPTWVFKEKMLRFKTDRRKNCFLLPHVFLIFLPFVSVQLCCGMI